MTAKDRGIGMVSVKVLSLLDYVEGALKRAEYYRDENRVVIGKVPGVAGFFAQGDSFEDARENLKDVIEGNLLLALQLGLEIPCFEGVGIEDVEIKAPQGSGNNQRDRYFKRGMDKVVGFN
jgi:predicted RNase H-like HicB family nuclease